MKRDELLQRISIEDVDILIREYQPDREED
jgi:hypothetical protein